MRARWRANIASSVRMAQSFACPFRISSEVRSSEPSMPCASRQRSRGTFLRKGTASGWIPQVCYSRQRFVVLDAPMCGVIGIHGHDEAANIAYLGMHALQHRGQESAGLVAAEDGKLRRHVAMGLVS